MKDLLVNQKNKWNAIGQLLTTPSFSKDDPGLARQSTSILGNQIKEHVGTHLREGTLFGKEDIKGESNLKLLKENTKVKITKKTTIRLQFQK